MGTIFYLCYQIVSVSTPDTELASYTPVEMKEGIVFDQIWLHKEDLYMVRFKARQHFPGSSVKIDFFAEAGAKKYAVLY